ncbi:HAD family hydrolase [Allonocardiopsis opalescens]|uniref:HAD family hydrolase n=1 Tax=Allonocardiopsis opalescens TaxID=1144618 RepID=UPI000D05EA5D|nr:haloacid dehalogenase-like hydrolase [Allonocardiopsis opalescens]
MWSIDRTLLDVGKVTRDACAEAFEWVTGRPLVRLVPTEGRTDSEIFFEFLAVNRVATDEKLLPAYTQQLERAFAERRRELFVRGRLMPGADVALAAVGRLDATVQTVLTGSIRPNALAKLEAFGLTALLDTEIGGYGSEDFPKGSLLQVVRSRAREAYTANFTDETTVFVSDAVRDIEAAHIGGASALAVASGAATEGELREAGADLVLPDLTDAIAVRRAIRDLTGG